ncbi:MAG: GxxExxY protein [Wenzhouxiangellaceae bacterium]
MAEHIFWVDFFRINFFALAKTRRRQEHQWNGKNECVERLNNAHNKQLLTYLKLTDRKLGYLLNFGSIALLVGTELR